MRIFTVVLISLLVAAGVLPATAQGDEPTPSASPSASPSPSGSQSPPPDPVPAVYPVFNYPTPGNPDDRINSELTRLLNEAPAGAQISAALYVVAPNYQVVDALIAAAGRGVGTRVVLAYGKPGSPSGDTFAKLAPVLGTDPAAPSFVMQCVNACISKLPDSINHNKFVAMSATGTLNNVVFQSTANVRSDGSGDAAWNAATVNSGGVGLYESYLTYFGNLAARATVPNNNYYAIQPPASTQVWTPYYFPQNDSFDSVSQTLMKVQCQLTPTKVDVMASFFTRAKVRNRLNEMAAAGCDVRVIARQDSITREFCDSLKAPIAVKISDKPASDKVGIHGKYISIAGGFDGRADQELVWMGSENLTRNALIANDETFLLIDQPQLHAQFQENFQRIWDHPSLTAGCGRAGGTEEEIEQADDEVVPLIKEAQRVKRNLPKRLKKRTELKSTRTVQKMPLTTEVKCRVKGTSQKLKQRKICALKKPKSNPTVVLTPARKKRLSVRITQKAPGSATLEKFSRKATYTYRR